MTFRSFFRSKESYKVTKESHDMKDVSEAIGILKDAYALINEGHWLQGSMTDGHNGYCAVGALRVAAFDDIFTIPYRDGPMWGDYKIARRALADAIDLATDSLWKSDGTPIAPDDVETYRILRWNDMVVPERTKAEVLDALDKASHNLGNSAVVKES